ncbi:hypothetical protein [Roseivivax sp. CAU 1761]
MTTKIQVGAPERARTAYSVELDVEDFLAITKAEDDGRIAYEETLSAPLEGIHPYTRHAAEVEGISAVEYNGHFGAAIHYTVDDENETEGTHAKVADIIRGQVVRARRPAVEPAPAGRRSLVIETCVTPAGSTSGGSLWSSAGGLQEYNEPGYIMKKTATSILLLAALGACATPQQRCESRALKEVREIERRIEVAQGNIDRGYAVHVSREPRTSVGVCTGNRGRVSVSTCMGTNNGPRETPVAIDVVEERRKVEELRERLTEAHIRLQTRLQQCSAYGG